MAVDIDRFLQIRPYVYHVTARENGAALARTMALEPASTLMRLSGRTDLLRWRRPESVRLICGGETIVLKDQAHLIEKSVALYRGWTFADFIEYLNELVFFWPGTADGPIKSGMRVHDTSSLLLRIPTEALLSVNPAAVPLFCLFNSGAPRQQEARRALRGPRLFTVAADFPRRESQVVELAFRSRAELPAETMIAESDGWRQLSTLISD